MTMAASWVTSNRKREQDPPPPMPQALPPPIYQPNPFFSSLPPGWSFKPSDAVIAKYYLFNKVYDRPLPPHKIVDVDLYCYSPDTLADVYKAYEEEGKWYFFTPTERKYKNGSRPSRSAGNGFWKATIADKEVKVNDEVLALKKTLVYYRGKPRQSEKTDWIMYEFRLNNSRTRNREDMKLDDWVLCQIHKRREGEAKRNKSLMENKTSAMVVPQDEGGSTHQTQGGFYHKSAPTMPSEACPSNIQNVFVACTNINNSINGRGDLQQPMIFRQTWNNNNVDCSSIGGHNYIEQQTYLNQTGDCYYPATPPPPSTCEVGGQQHTTFGNWPPPEPNNIQDATQNRNYPGVFGQGLSSQASLVDFDWLNTEEYPTFDSFPGPSGLDSFTVEEFMKLMEAGGK